jgi:hypothetical protein
MKLLPINISEAVFESFWDPNTSKLDQWKVVDVPERGLKVHQSWDSVPFEWNSPPADGSALVMSRQYDSLDCSGYDKLLTAAVIFAGYALALNLETDRGLSAGNVRHRTELHTNMKCPCRMPNASHR